MRVALFTDTYPPEVNGVANSVRLTAEALAKRGHEVCVVTASSRTKKELAEESKGAFRIEVVPSIRLPIYLGVRFTAPIGFAMRAMREFKPDIIHAHTPFSVGWEAVIASHRLGVPLIGTHHTFFNHYLKYVHLDHQWAQDLSWALTVGYYNRCDHVVSPTRSLADDLRAHHLRKPCDIIQNAIDTDFYRPEQYGAMRSTSASIIYTGRVGYEKSIDQAIRAFAIASKELPELKFIIAGDGPARAELETLVDTLNIRSSVVFTGFVYGEQLRELLRSSQLYVTASKSENMPLAVLEAMACGLPIIAVNSLGLAEIVEHEKNGYLLGPDQPGAMAAHILALMRDDDRRRAFSTRSRELALHYSMDAVMSRLESLYSKVITHRKP